MITNAASYDLIADEALNVRAKLRQIFGGVLRTVTLQRTVHNALRKRWIEIPARTLRNHDQQIAVWTEMPPVRLPKLAMPRVRRTRDDQRPLRRGQTRTNGGKNLRIGIRRD